jgi:prepilin-type N-terminal cleavage/methylation domain-containing protein
MASPAEMGSMPTLSAGKTKQSLADARGSEALLKRDRQGAAGVTLIEMMVVVALIALMVGVSYPSITSGIDSLRLNAATNGVVSFLDYGLSRAERRQQMVEITISKADNALEMRSSERGFYRKLQMPEGVSIVQVLPQLPEQSADDPDLKRDFLLYPGGTVPPMGLQLINRRKVQRIVRVDPITGVPRVETAPLEPEQ